MWLGNAYPALLDANKSGSTSSQYRPRSPFRLHHNLILKVPGNPYPKPLQTLTLFLIKIRLNI